MSNKLTSGNRERAVSLVLNHGCKSGSYGFSLLSNEDQRLVKRIESEWNAQDKADEKLISQLKRGIALKNGELP